MLRTDNPVLEKKIMLDTATCHSDLLCEVLMKTRKICSISCHNEHCPA